MKKLAALLAVTIVTMATVAAARQAPPRVSDAEVQAAIDARLHVMLIELNARRGR